MSEPSAGDTALLHLAAFYALAGGRKERARGLLERLISQQPENHQACC
jgi:hypothetical protein